MDIRPKTTPVAPLALVPSPLTKYVSAMLYTLVTSMLMMVGTARAKTSLQTGVAAIRLYCL